MPLDFHRSSTAVIDRLPVSWSGTVDGIPCSVVISCLTFEVIFVLVLGEGFH